MGARDKINAISLNVKINKGKSVHERRCKLPINVQNAISWHDKTITQTEVPITKAN